MKKLVIICSVLIVAFAMLWVSTIRAEHSEDCKKRCERVSQCEPGSTTCTWETTCGTEPYSCEVPNRKANSGDPE